MKTKQNLQYLAVLASGMGLAAMVLRRMLYHSAVDAAGLLVRRHPLEIVLWILTLTLVVLVLLGLRGTRNVRGYSRNYPAPRISAAGSGVMALGLALTAVTGRASGTMGSLDFLLGLAAAAAMGAVTVCRVRQAKPYFLYHGLVCLFFAFHLIGRYRAWCGDPQLQDYVFSLFACVALMLFCYHQAALDGGCGQRRQQLTTGLLAVFFCLTALSRTENPILYFSGAIWTLTNLSALRGPEPDRSQEVTAHDPA